MIKSIMLALTLTLTLTLARTCASSSVVADQGESFFNNSYAVVIAIDDYRDPKRQQLAYPVKDGRAFADFLKRQGFHVIELYDQFATREKILNTLETWLVSVPRKDDRVLVFFAGHGDSRDGAGGDRGYLVPYDASLISFVELRELSAASAARHQLVILDACFAGLAAPLRGVFQVDRSTPDYLFKISTRPARQLLAAGGANERVLDAGPEGHSLFMGHLLRALTDGLGDANEDGIVTATELFSYVEGAASIYTQTPIFASFPGHGGGDFWFVNPTAPRLSLRANPSLMTDPYIPLNDGRAALITGNDAKARAEFERAARLGNAEAMNYLGKLLWEGAGGEQDQRGAIAWLKLAAKLGYPGAMENLGIAYQQAGKECNLEESQRWFAAFAAARRIDSRISPPESRIQAPKAPTGLTVN